MKNKVLIHMETVFDKDGDFEDNMFFYTEGELEKSKDGYRYYYDESALYPGTEELVGMLEVGENYVTRSISGIESYVMHFKENHRDQVVFDSEYGPLQLSLFTEKIEQSLVEGLGYIKLRYKVNFAPGGTMVNEITIRIEDGEQ